MIIYRRKDNDVVIPCGLGPVVCPDTSHDLQMKMVDSSTVLQHVEPDSGYYGLYRVIVNPIYDANLLAENIKNGVTILGVMGTYAGTVLNLQAKSVNPSTELQVVTFDQPYNGLSSVTIAPVTADIDPDILAENIKKDVEILGVVGTFEGGPLQNKSVNSSTSSQSVTPDPSYYGLSQVTVSPYTVEGKSQTITQNGTYTFAPTSADALSDVSISVQVAGTPATVQAKSVSYNVNGEYTVTPDQGYDGLSSVDISVNVPTSSPVLQAKTVNSSTASQTVQSDGGYDGLSEVIVNPYTVEANSSTLTQNGTYSFSPVNADALSGVTVNVSVDGGQTVNNQAKTVNSSTSSQSVTFDSGYTGLSQVTVNPYTLDTKTVNPSTNSITVNSSADGMSSVTVNAVTASIDPDIQAGNIKSGVNILGVTGTYTGDSSSADTVYLDTFAIEKIQNNDSYIETNYLPDSNLNHITGFVKGSLIGGPDAWNTIYSLHLNFEATIHNNLLTFRFGENAANYRVNFTNDEVDFEHGIMFDASLNGNEWTVTANGVTKTCSNAFPSSHIHNVWLLESYLTALSFITFENGADSWTFSPIAVADVSNNLINSYYGLALRELHSVGGVDTVNYITEDSNGNSLLTNYRFVTYEANTSTGEIMDLTDASRNVVMFPIGDYPSGVKLPTHSLGSKTIDSSTVSQIVTPDASDYGLSSVTVNPYTVESDSSTLTQNGQYTFSPVNADALSSITVNVSVDGGQTVNNQNKTVNPSTNSQSITADSGYTGLGTVTVNPMNLEPISVEPEYNDRTYTAGQEYDGLASVEVLGVSNYMDVLSVNASTDAQIFTPESPYLGYDSVIVNPYTTETDSSTLTQNGTYTFTPQNADALSSVTIDVSVDASAGSDWYSQFKLAQKHDFSDVDLSPLMSEALGLYATFKQEAATTEQASRFITALPILDASTAGHQSLAYTFESVYFDPVNGVDVVFPNLVSGEMYATFRNAYNVNSFSLPELTTITSGGFYEAFRTLNNGNNIWITSVSMPKLRTVSGQVQTWLGAHSSLALTIHPDALRYSSINYNLAYWISDFGSLNLTDTVTNDVYLTSTSATISKQVIYEVLRKLSSDGTGKNVVFGAGRTVEDYADGRIQTAYNTAVNNGWTIQNLTITPYSGPTYVTSIAQPNSQDVVMTIPEVYSRDTVLEMDYYCPDTTGDSPLGGFVSGNYMCRIIFNLDVLGGTVIDYDRDGNARTIINDSYTVGARHILELDQYNGGTHYQKISVDGSAVATANKAKTTVHDLSNGAYFDLFKIDNSYTQPGFTYYGVKWYEYVNGVKTLVHDYRPALDTNNVPGFYDEVTQQYLVPTSGTLDYTA